MAEEKYFEYRRSEMLTFVPGTVKKSLEVGCGSGNFSDKLKNKGIETWGIEPNPKACEISKGKLFRVYNGFFEDFKEELSNEKFDIIIFNDVLEHMENPWGALAYAKDLLSSDGVVVSSIPNFLYYHSFFRFLISKDFKYEKSGIFDKTHLRFFTRKSIVRMFSECGYSIEQIEGIHQTTSKKFKIFNMFTLGFFSEMKFLQYGIRAKFKN